MIHLQPAKLLQAHLWIHDQKNSHCELLGNISRAVCALNEPITFNRLSFFVRLRTRIPCTSWDLAAWAIYEYIERILPVRIILSHQFALKENAKRWEWKRKFVLWVMGNEREVLSKRLEIIDGNWSYLACVWWLAVIDIDPLIDFEMLRETKESVCENLRSQKASISVFV